MKKCEPGKCLLDRQDMLDAKLVAAKLGVVTSYASPISAVYVVDLAMRRMIRG